MTVKGQTGLKDGYIQSIRLVFAQNKPEMKFLPSSGRQKRCSTKQFHAKSLKSAKKPHKLVKYRLKEWVLVVFLF